jgi:hypothetical protein
VWVWHTEAFFHPVPTDMARLTDTIYNTAMAFSGLAISSNKGYFEWRHSPDFRSANTLLAAIDIVCMEKTTGQELSLSDLPPSIHDRLAKNADFQLSEADSVARQVLLEISARGHKTMMEAGYLNLKKVWAINEANGHTNLKAGREILRKAEYPNLKIVHQILKRLGYPNMKNGHKTMAAAGYPNLRQGDETERKNRWPNLANGNALMKLRGWNNLKQGNATQKANNYATLSRGRVTRKKNAEERRINKAGASVPTYEFRAGPHGEQEAYYHIKLGITKR